MKKLIFLLVLCLIASSANASFQVFRDNYNVNLISSGPGEAHVNWRLDAMGRPDLIPGQEAKRQASGVFSLMDYVESEDLWHRIQAGSEDGDLPPELEPPNAGTKAGTGYFPGAPGQGAENAVQVYSGGGLMSISPNYEFCPTDLEVYVDVHVPLNTAVGDAAYAWVGLGGQNTSATTGVALYYDDSWEVYSGGGIIASGAAGGFASSLVGATDLQMVPVALDVIGGDLSVSVAGTPLVTDAPLTLNGTYITLGLNGGSQAGGVIDWFTFFDNLDVWGVPEPATIALLGLGALALLRKRR
jgi:hypothetical protein